MFTLRLGWTSKLVYAGDMEISAQKDSGRPQDAASHTRVAQMSMLGLMVKERLRLWASVYAKLWEYVEG